MLKRSEPAYYSYDFAELSELHIPPINMAIAKESRIYKYFAHDYPNFGQEKIICSRIKDANFKNKDVSLFVFVFSYKSLFDQKLEKRSIAHTLLEKGAAKENLPSLVEEKLTENKLFLLKILNHPGFYTDFMQFLSQAMEQTIDRIAKVKSAKELDRILDLTHGVADYLVDLIHHLNEFDKEKAKELSKLSIKFLKEVKSKTAAHKDFPLKKQKIDTDQAVYNLNIKLADQYLVLGATQFHEAKDPSDLSSLRYFSKAYSLIGYTHSNGSENTYSMKYACQSYLCALSIRSGNLEQAEEYASAIIDCYKKLNGEIPNLTIPVPNNNFALLAQAFYTKGDYTSAIQWYATAINFETNAEKKKKYQFLLSTIKLKETEAISQQKKAIINLKEKYPLLTIDFDSNNNNKPLLAVKSRHNKLRLFSLAMPMNLLELEIEKLGNNENELTQMELTQLESYKQKEAERQSELNANKQLSETTSTETKAQEKEITGNVQETKPAVKKKHKKTDVNDDLSKSKNKKTSNKSDQAKEETSKNKQTEIITEPDVDPYELFGEDCEGQIVYPLVSKYIGRKPVYFGIFNPPEKTNLTKEGLDLHRNALEKGKIGPGEGIRQTSDGVFKTEVISHSGNAGDYRFGSRGDKATRTKNGVTYHLIDFNELHTHKTQGSLYRRK